MDVLVFIIIVVAAFAGLDWIAYRFGVDSRPTIGDDHARRAGY